MRLAVTGVGIETALGRDRSAVAAAIAEGRTALAADAVLGRPSARCPDVDLRAVLLRRKDIKLLARPSELALAACARALEGLAADREPMGIVFAVGREPVDDGTSEASLLASHRDGQLDEGLLAGPGRDLYPPLLPLQTLPNMALAHCSINLGIRGPNGVWAGGPEAAVAACDAAWWDLVEGRVDALLLGGTDSHTARGAARDLVRLGIGDGAGEAAVGLVLEREPSGPVLGFVSRDEGLTPDSAALRRALGWTGAAERLLALALALAPDRVVRLPA